MKILYYNGFIRTPVGCPATALLTEGGKITAVGSREELEPLAAGGERVNLEGGTLLPGFIDAHSHLSSLAASFLQIDLTDCTSREEAEARIRTFVARLSPGAWALGRGYDPGLPDSGRVLTPEMLDAWAPGNPLVLQHVSGHSGLFNARAL